jgi:RNA polymerase sigma-70 factor (ECF subfamily)
LYRTARYLTGNVQLAEEIVQETALKAIQSRDTFDTTRPFRPWIFAIMRHTLQDYYRLNGRQPDMFALNEDELSLYNKPSPENALLKQILDEDIEQALQQLPQEMGLAVILVDIEGFSYQELADTFNWPLGTVMSRLHRGRHKLRVQLADYAQKRGLINQP